MHELCTMPLALQRPLQNTMGNKCVKELLSVSHQVTCLNTMHSSAKNYSIFELFSHYESLSLTQVNTLNATSWLQKHEVFQDWKEVYRSVLPLHVIISVYKGLKFRTEGNSAYMIIFQSSKLSRKVIYFEKGKRETLTGCPL